MGAPIYEAAVAKEIGGFHGFKIRALLDLCQFEKMWMRVRFSPNLGESATMRMTKRTNLAMRVLMYCAVNKGRLVTKAEISDVCQTSENHLAQVINELGHLGYLNTHRGRNGGVELAGAADDIMIGEIFRLMEGPVPKHECFADSDGSCPLVEACRLKVALRHATEAFFASLDDLTLGSLICNNKALQKILLPDPCLS